MDNLLKLIVRGRVTAYPLKLGGKKQEAVFRAHLLEGSQRATSPSGPWGLPGLLCVRGPQGAPWSFLMFLGASFHSRFLVLIFAGTCFSCGIQVSVVVRVS